MPIQSLPKALGSRRITSIKKTNLPPASPFSPRELALMQHSLAVIKSYAVVSRTLLCDSLRGCCHFKDDEWPDIGEIDSLCERLNAAATLRDRSRDDAGAHDPRNDRED